MIDEIRAIYTRHITETPVETDATKRLLRAHGVLPGTRLWQLYDAKLTADSAVQQVEAQRAAAQQALMDLHFRLRRLQPDVTLTMALPSVEQARDYAEIQAHATLVRHCLDGFEQMAGGVKIKRHEAQQNWDGAWRMWADAMYGLTGNRDFAPAVVGGAWSAPTGYERANFEAQRAQWEA